ncbi:MAG: 1-acyl-sn-glycerol-3-phosphate acyltransferase [Leptospiraceae bacterium]|nr:1-acyl-sn-glycerol-3-phosphate acyltransferase [Leptospiraceae bacterium]MCP5497928.1 1-acyl-sn-glycerol-3-phosphate acyltransferase [Leptospiraceae bacterium]
MAEKDSNLSKWQKEFFENIHIFEQFGMSKEEAKELLGKFLHLSMTTPVSPVMNIFKEPSELEKIGVYTESKPEAREFMRGFLTPIMKNFKVDGIENLIALNEIAGKLPITIISNHVSHLDAPSIFQLIYNSCPEGKNIAERIVFIAGRLAFEPDFTRLGLYMFGTILVCSKRDMVDNPSLSDLMVKINARAFRQAQKLQQNGKILAIFPEGTRSRDGRLMPFVEAVYHYVANRVVLPVSLEGTDKILPTSGFLFNAASGKLTIGKPVLVGDLPEKQKSLLPPDIEHIKFPEIGDKKQFIIDGLALLVGSNLSKHKHGTYRNLYNGDRYALNDNVLIQTPAQPEDNIVIIGSSNMSLAIATIMSNKNVVVNIYDPDEEYCKKCNEERRDTSHFSIYKLPPNIIFTSDPNIISKATLLIQGTNPWNISKIYQSITQKIKESSAPIVNVIKGFSDSPKGLILDDLMNYGVDQSRLLVAFGASYPDQIMERKISGFEIAAADPTHIPKLLKLLSTGYIFARKAIIENDIVGVQLGGALKTVYAFSMGIVEGYYKQTLGGNIDNTLFHLSNRFFKEMVSVGVKLGGKEETFNGLSGLTDFMLACFGTDTRDRKLGFDFVMGAPLSKVTSGYYGLKVLPNLLELNFEKYPILSSTYDIVFNNKSTEEALEKIQTKLTRIF